MKTSIETNSINHVNVNNINNINNVNNEYSTVHCYKQKDITKPMPLTSIAGGSSVNLEGRVLWGDTTTPPKFGHEN